MNVSELAALAITTVLCGCQGPPPGRVLREGLGHDAGDTFMAGHAFYGIPILHKSFFWDGQGEVDDTGIGVQAGHYVANDVALGGKFDAASWWTPGRDVYSGEIEGLLRINPWHDGPVFIDGTGGFQLANDQIPPGGTVWNFTFSFGGGVELPVDRGSSVLLGAMYHHISNALGRENDRNPSQNEVRLWIGFGWTF